MASSHEEHDVSTRFKPAIRVMCGHVYVEDHTVFLYIGRDDVTYPGQPALFYIDSHGLVR